jgi:hypothetical protein
MESTYINNANTIQPRQNNTPSKVKLMTHHQFPGIELVSPMYVSDGATCYLSPDQKVDAGSTEQVDFNINLNQRESIGALMYKLQRKNISQSNEDIISSEDELTCTMLIIIWNVNCFKDFYVYSRIIEHDKDRVLNRDSLMKLAEQYSLFGIQYGPIEEAWLIYDDIRLMTSLNAIHEEECYKLEMTISEPSANRSVQRLWHIDSDR